ncbi:MAG: hypothetical protein PVF39_04445 [Desulfobacterales bacterium]|jgi:hypothetical protein
MAQNIKGQFLIDRVIERHGGIDLWATVEQITMQAQTGGIALPLRFKFGAFKNYQAQIRAHEPHVQIRPHPREGMQGIFSGEKVCIETENGESVQQRNNARSVFSDMRHKIWWDHLDAIHFAGYALWNYMTTPFLLCRPEIQLQEMPPWQENNETWQRLQATFPPGLLTHSPEQTFYFDAEGMLKRHDYTALVFGNFAKAAHYSWNHKEVNGIPFPTRRRVFPRRKDGSPLRLVTLVSIDIEAIEVEMKSNAGLSPPSTQKSQKNPSLS